MTFAALGSRFRQLGYAVIPGALSAEAVALIRNSAESMAEVARDTLNQAADRNIDPGEIPRHFDGLVVVPEAGDRRQVCRVEDSVSQFPGISDLVEREIRPLVSDLMGESYVVFKDKLNFKWPNGGGFAPHQDFPAFGHFKPRSHVSVMITIDPATEENGCVQFAHGYRKDLEGDSAIDKAALARGDAVIPFEGDTMNAEYVERFDWRPAPTGPSDLVLFDSFVPHYSEPNRSGRSRRALFLTFNRESEGEWRDYYYERKRNDPGNPMFHFATPTTSRGG